jgi:hypothetical protein
LNRGGSEQRGLVQNRSNPQIINSERPRSLNPQIYPAWWGDDSIVQENPKPKNTFQLAAARVDTYVSAGQKDMFQDSIQ